MNAFELSGKLMSSQSKAALLVSEIVALVADGLPQFDALRSYEIASARYGYMLSTYGT